MVTAFQSLTTSAFTGAAQPRHTAMSPVTVLNLVMIVFPFRALNRREFHGRGGGSWRIGSGRAATEVLVE
jgi:hypothetical protein